MFCKPGIFLLGGFPGSLFFILNIFLLPRSSHAFCGVYVDAEFRAYA